MTTPRILVLEDDDFLRRSLVGVLEDEDYRVEEAAGSDQALQLVSQMFFDLVVADVRMEGTDGLDCLAQIRQVEDKARFIVITGYADEDAPSRAMSVRVDDYLYKPFELDHFLDAIERVLAAGGERAGYEKLLGAVISGYKKLRASASQALANAEIAQVEGLRDQTFQAFFVGVRSRKLDPVEAIGVWDRIQALEEDRVRLMRQGVGAVPRGELGEGYRYTCDLIGALKHTDMYIGQDRPDGGVPQEQFKHFYDAISDGSLSQEQVRQAATLRLEISEVALGQSRQLQELFHEIWGVAPS